MDDEVTHIPSFHDMQVHCMTPAKESADNERESSYLGTVNPSTRITRPAIPIIYNGQMDAGIPALCWKMKEAADPGFSLYDLADRLRSRGWHDAGDFDLPAGAVAGTVLWLALAQEEFPGNRDVTSVSRSERLVELFESDGKTDMLQQVAFGMEYLLGLYRELGHIGAGIIANNGPDYGRVGDPTSITDGLIYNPQLQTHEQEGGQSGTFDDRWVLIQPAWAQEKIEGVVLHGEAGVGVTGRLLNFLDVVLPQFPYSYRLLYKDLRHCIHVWDLTSHLQNDRG